MARDILLDNSGKIRIENGDFVVGESTLQEVELLLRLNQGNWKFSPLLGPNLVRYIKSNADPDTIQSAVAMNLKMDGKDYNEIKKIMTLK